MKNMIGSIAAFSKKVRPNLLAGFLLLPTTISAQSGISIQSDQPATSKSSSRDKRHVPETATYKLVFAPSYEGQLGYIKNPSDQERSRISKFRNFVSQLNEVGEQGYKLVSILGGNLALVKREGGQFEYDGFETISSVYFAKSGLSTKLNELSRRGFKIVGHSLLEKNCEMTTDEYFPNYEVCKYLDLFLVGKEKGTDTPTNQVVVGSMPGWGAKPSSQLEEQIAQNVADGFVPVSIVSDFEILLERAGDNDRPWNNRSDIQIVRTSSSTDSLVTKVNALAKQGYRLTMTNYRIAVLYRNDETKDSPVSYVWVRTDPKDLAKELTKLQAKGAIFKGTYPNDKGSKNTLIFELPQKGNPTEYSVMRFDFDIREDRGQNTVYVDLTEPSKNLLSQVIKMVEQGYEPRELFDAKGTYLLLEKKKP